MTDASLSSGIFFSPLDQLKIGSEGDLTVTSFSSASVDIAAGTVENAVRFLPVEEVGVPAAEFTHDGLMIEDDVLAELVSPPVVTSRVGNIEYRHMSWNSNGVYSNSGGLTGRSVTKLRFCAMMFTKFDLDTFSVIDSRMGAADLPYATSFLRNALPGSLFKVLLTPTTTGSGGQLLIYRSTRVAVTSFSSLADHGALVRAELKVGDSTVVLLSTYWPVQSVLPGSLWCKLGVADPIGLIKGLTKEAMNLALAKSQKIVWSGDMNSDYTHNLTDCFKLKEFLEEAPVVNSSKAPAAPTFVYRKNGRPMGSCIDHICVGGSNIEVVNSFPFMEGEFMNDHLPLLLRVKILDGNITTSKKKMNQLLVRDVNRADSKRVQRVVAAMPEVLIGLPIEPDLVLEALSVRTVALVQRVFRAQKKRPDGWSPHMMTYCYNLEYIIKMRRYCLGQGGYKQWNDRTFPAGIKRLRKEWKQKLRSLSRTPEEFAQFKGLGLFSCCFWEDLSMEQILSAEPLAMRAVHGMLHGRERKEYRLALSDRHRCIERARESNKLRQVVQAVCGGSTPGFNMESLDLGGLTEVDPSVITSTLTDHFKDWFARSKDTHPGGIGDIGAHWSDLDCAWEKFHETYQGTNIPENTLRTLHQAIVFRRTDSSVRDAFHEDVMRRPTLAELKESIRRRPSDSAPSVTGCSYNMLKLWPEEVLEVAYKALDSLWDDMRIPDYWRWRYLVLLPKKPDPTLHDLRPLTLVDTLRKVWVAIFVDRIQKFVSKSGALSDNQHAYLYGKGTDTAAAQLLHALETARELKTDMFFTSWDMKKAFDSVSKAVLVFSWIRIGVPEALAVYMVDMDIGGSLLVRSPEVVAAVKSDLREAIKRFGFETVIGTGQGDIPSPLNWDCFIDILLTALEIDSRLDVLKGNFLVADADGFLIPMPEICFADDLLSVKARLEALQRSADIVSAFCIIFDLKLSMEKFRAFMVIWGNDKRELPDELIIHTKGWVPMVMKLELSGSFKHLGVTSDVDASSSTQHAMHLALLKKSLGVIKVKRLSDEAKWVGISKSLYAKIAYSAKFESVSLNKLEELDVPIQIFLRSQAKMLPGFPNTLLFAGREVMGLGFEKLSERVMRDKEALLQRLTRSDPACAGGLMRRALVYNGVVPVPHVSVVSPLLLEKSPKRVCWGTSLLSRYSRVGVQYSKSGRLASEADTPVVEVLDLNGECMASDVVDTLARLGVTLMGEFYMLGDHLGPLLDIFPFASSFEPCPQMEMSLRVGQCWMLPNYDEHVFEIMGFFRDEGEEGIGVSVIPWGNPHGNRAVGSYVEVAMADYTQGAGTHGSVAMIDFYHRNASLVILSGERHLMRGKMRRNILSVRYRRAHCEAKAEQRRLPIAFGGATSCTTDGSYSKSGNVIELVTGSEVVRCGAAMVMMTGDVFSGAVEVKCNGALHSGAPSVELVALQAGVLVDEALEFRTDCKGAKGALERFSHGKPYSHKMGWLMADLRNRGRNLKWIRSHPERRGPIAAFNAEEKAIFAADLLAGGDIDGFVRFTGVERSAIQIITDVEVFECLAQSAVFQLRLNGSPLTKSMSDLVSEHSMQVYQANRSSFLRYANPRWAYAIAPKQKKTTPYAGHGGWNQAVRICWQWHWLGDREARFGTGSDDVDVTERGLCQMCGLYVETQAHVIRECMGGSMHRIRVAAERDVNSMVLKEVKRGYMAATVMESYSRIAFSHSLGHELWVGMLSPTMVGLLEEIVERVPMNLAKSTMISLRNVSRILRHACDDVYTERSRLLSKKRMAGRRAIPTIPADYLALIARRSREGYSKASRATRRSIVLPPSLGLSNPVAATVRISKRGRIMTDVDDVLTAAVLVPSVLTGLTSWISAAVTVSRVDPVMDSMSLQGVEAGNDSGVMGGLHGLDGILFGSINRCVVSQEPFEVFNEFSVTAPVGTVQSSDLLEGEGSDEYVGVRKREGESGVKDSGKRCRLACAPNELELMDTQEDVDGAALDLWIQGLSRESESVMTRGVHVSEKSGRRADEVDSRAVSFRRRVVRTVRHDFFAPAVIPMRVTPVSAPGSLADDVGIGT